MIRLSIIIPMLGNAKLMESGLVSVLENRPAGCEVLLVLNGDYDDPYELEDEVRFVAARHGATWAESCRQGIEETTAEFVHLLMPGVEVTTDWADHALRHFAAADVGAVAPLVLDAKKPRRIISAGVAQTRRRLIAGTRSADQGTVKLPKTIALGPSCLAGFYRRAYLVALGSLEPKLGDDWADLDLALRSQAAGLRTVVATDSLVTAPRPQRVSSAFRRGLCQERLLARHAPSLGKALLSRLLALPLGLVSRILLPHRAVAHLAGQLCAWCELPRHLRFRSQQQQILADVAAQVAAAGQATARPGAFRVDSQHTDAKHVDGANGSRSRHSLRISA